MLRLEGEVIARTKKIINKDGKESEFVNYLISDGFNTFQLTVFGEHDYYQIGKTLDIPVTPRVYTRNNGTVSLSYSPFRDASSNF